MSAERWAVIDRPYSKRGTEEAGHYRSRFCRIGGEAPTLKDWRGGTVLAFWFPKPKQCELVRALEDR